MLSSTLNSPLHEGKKTKTFISPNRFAVLASDVTGDDPVFDTAPSFRDDTIVSSPHTMDHRTEPPAPPLYIRNIINFSAFKNVLIKTVGLDGFTCKSTPSYLIVRPNGRDNFNALANYLMETNANFHTFRPPVDRPFSIVIRNLHHSTLSADISTALLEEGHIECKFRTYSSPQRGALGAQALDIGPPESYLKLIGRFRNCRVLAASEYSPDQVSTLLLIRYPNTAGSRQLVRIGLYPIDKTKLRACGIRVVTGTSELGDPPLKDFELPRGCSPTTRGPVLSTSYPYRNCKTFDPLAIAE
ncbi:hypothetical protein QTP88_013326 [Uroleucon formosanum]